MARLGAHHRNVKLNHLQTGNGAEDLFDRHHDAGERRTLPVGKIINGVLLLQSNTGTGAS
jgi:hypothetical protein